MRRREFIGGLGGAVAWPLTARTQQAPVPVVGVLNQSTFDERWRDRMEVFRKGLAETGFVEGRSVAIEYRWAEDRYDRLPALADDLVRRKVAVIVATAGMPATTAAMAASQTVPIVFFVGTNPVEYGLVASLARPGGNATGFTQFVGELMAKRMELLHQLVPDVTSIAFLFNPTNPATATEEVRRAGRVLGLEVLMIGAARQSDIDSAFAEMAQQHAGAVVVIANTLFYDNMDQLAGLAARHKLPALFSSREPVVAGGLISYGPSLSAISAQYREAGIYTGRILKGEKPADLPVQQPTKLELVINLQAAKALGLTVPPSLLVAADEVIE
jgi:putative tryptophan/tyrosine transport system substrate-binding protein